MRKMMVLIFILLSLVVLYACESSPRMTVEVINLNDEVMFRRSLVIDLEKEISLLDFLIENIDIDYTEFSFGVFINGIETHYPSEYQITYNYYFGLYIDGKPSEVGISDIELKEGMTLSFIEQTMLDEVDLKVDQVIYGFLDSHLDTYITSEDLHAHVFAAIWQLNNHHYRYLLTGSPTSPVENIGRETLGQFLKTVLLEIAFDLDLDTSITELSSFEIQNHYEALTVLKLQSLLGFSLEQKLTTISYLTTSLPQYMDSDYAGMVLLALSNYNDIEGVTSFKEEMLQFIIDNQSNAGITAWGSANSASTAVAILGLLAQNLDPRSETFTIDDIDLIEALLTFELNDAFKWTLSQETPDFAFSTPQAFAALVAYKIYRDNFIKTPFNLFALN